MPRDAALTDEHDVDRRYKQGFSTATAASTTCPTCGMERFAWVAECPQCERRAELCGRS